jgi:hypothetical protein
MQRKSRLLVYDTDGANPYGRELAALLCQVLEVEVVASVQAEWSPPPCLHPTHSSIELAIPNDLSNHSSVARFGGCRAGRSDVRGEMYVNLRAILPWVASVRAA